jgi:exocyst complex component 6
MSPSDSCCFSQAQANLLLSQGLSFDPSKPTFPALLEEVVGFFLVEHHVLQTSPPGWRAEQEVDDLWDNMCERVVDIVGTGLKNCKDTNVYVSTKSAIMTFIQTLEVGLDTTTHCNVFCRGRRLTFASL